MYQDYIAKQECNFLWDKINEIGSYVELNSGLSQMEMGDFFRLVRKDSHGAEPKKISIIKL